jgi:hypothetical protein
MGGGGVGTPTTGGGGVGTPTTGGGGLTALDISSSEGSPVSDSALAALICVHAGLRELSAAYCALG